MLDGDGDDVHEGVSEAADDIDEYLKELGGAEEAAGTEGGVAIDACEDDDLDAYLGELELSADEGDNEQDTELVLSD